MPPSGPSLPPPDSGEEDTGALDNSLEAAIRQLEVEQGRKGEDAGPEAPARKPPPTPKANQWANLNRRERELATNQQSFAKERADFQRQKADFEAKLKRGKEAPFEALRAIGWEDPKSFLEHVAETGGEWTPEQKQLYELRQWKEQKEREEQERVQRQQEETQAQEYRQAVDGWHKDIATYVRQSPQWRDSLVAIPGTEASVFQVIQDHYRETGEQLEYEEALAKVNSGMEGELQSALSQVAALPRGRAILEEVAAKLAPQAPRRAKPTASKTSVSQVTQHTSAAPARELTLDEALAQSAAWLNQVTRR